MIKKVVSVFLLVLVLMSISAMPIGAVAEWDSLATASVYLEIVDQTYSGYAECELTAVCRYMEHKIDATFRLYQDDNDYACWTYTGVDIVDDIVTYPVTKGHDYYLGMHVKVKDADGNIIDETVGYTDIVSYY